MNAQLKTDHPEYNRIMSDVMRSLPDCKPARAPLDPFGDLAILDKVFRVADNLNFKAR